jgi:outer membrane protein OmpA-like peptidoglycan-associated protein
MSRSLRYLRWASIPVAAALSLSAAAQAPVVLKDQDITENALIEALTPAPADPGTGAPELKFRSLRVIRDNPAPADQLVRPARTPQASILITFETNSANLTPEARASVDVLAKALQAPQLAGFSFSIEGHADPRGGAELNLWLSQARAESVATYLVARHGLTRERLKPVGKGDRELMNTARPDAPENRRVTITTLPR